MNTYYPIKQPPAKFQVSKPHGLGDFVMTEKPCFLLRSGPFRYLAERLNPCHGNLCDNHLPLLTTRFPKPFRQAFFAIWVGLPTLVAQVVGIQLAQHCHPRLANGTDWHSFLRLPNQPFPNVGPTELLTVGPTNHSPMLAQLSC
ncbi:hypothetical protein AVEN_159589-1 [Araneus ventricosus]|uniref:Uncharacterized protein n=1 Tax=Araneus ventricosus TaxID=182803 RepID=A0A4Y2HFZ1_ARAVE|nr:hypothetical protein AVEN_159589-1 [Araneus ventricosus]